MNRLGNLQLLPGIANNEKSATMPAEWLARMYSDNADRILYVRDHLLGDVPDELNGFVEFFDARRVRLVKRIKRLLGQEGSE